MVLAEHIRPILRRLGSLAKPICRASAFQFNFFASDYDAERLVEE